MKKRAIVSIIVLAAFALVSGAGILALAAPGTQSDPFVTLSYLTEIFRPRIMADVSAAGQEMTDRFNEQMTDLETKLQASQASQPSAPNAADKFSVVTLSRGQSLTCSVGTEIMLRIGTAAGSGSAPALVDYTTGDTLSSGTALTANHMYLITIEGNGIRATADMVRVLVRGVYKLN